MISIGNIKLKHGLMLAPMAGVSDRAYRAVMKSFGAEYTVSEMISAKAVHYKDKKTDELARLTDDDRPAAIQLFGCDPQIMAESAAALEQRCSPEVIDINMGCPVGKIVGNGEGSALMKNIPLAASIVRAVCSAVRVPVSVKIRLGWDERHKNAVELALALEDAGASMIAVHGRTKTQMYAPPVDIDGIAAVRKALSIPVVANGGIYCAADAIEMIERTGCPAIMVGRGSYGNPFIFSEIICALEGRAYTPPTPQQILATARHHMKLLVADKGYNGVLEARRHVAWYIKGFDGAASMRAHINAATCEDDIMTMLDELERRL